MNATEMIQEYKSYLELVKNRSINTVRGYVADLEQLQQHFNVQEWAGLTEEMAVEYFKHLKTKLSDQSVARRIYSFRGFFKFLRKKNLSALTVFDEFEGHAIHRKLPKVLSVGDMQRLLGSIRQGIPALLGLPNSDGFLVIRDRAMLETLYSAGLRVSELCGANWQDLDWNKREIAVTKAKGNKTRLAPLGQFALEALLEYSKHYERWWKCKPEGAAPMFLSTWNMRMNTRTVPRITKKWCEIAGVKRISPHGFRHACASHLLEAGADLRVIQELLGHASIVTTTVYTHVTIKKIKSVHANMHPRA